MAFTVKDWKNAPNTLTPISEAALEDVERRVTDYADLLDTDSRQAIVGAEVTDVAPGPIADAYYKAFGSLDQLANGDIVMTYRRGTSHADAGDFGVIVQRRSTDRGGSFGSEIVIKSEAGINLDTGHCSGVTATGRHIVFYAPDDGTGGGAPTTSVDYIYSDDNGVSYSDGGSVALEADGAVLPNGSVITIADGRLMMTWFGFLASRYSVFAEFSDDDGDTWGDRVEVVGSTTDEYTEMSCAYLGGGNIVGLVRVNNGTTFSQVISDDNGATWTLTGPVDFDSWGTDYNGTPCLVPYRSAAGRRAIGCYYLERSGNYARVSYALGRDLIADGVGAWSGAKSIAPQASADNGSIAVIHPNGERRALGWYYENAGDIDFFTTTAPAFAETPAARVYRSGNSYPADATWTAIEFNASRYNREEGNGAMWVAGVPTKITPQTAGLYHLSGNVCFASGSAVGVRAVAIRLNGTTNIAVSMGPAGTTANNQRIISTDWELEVGDYVELVVYQTSGGELIVENQSSYSPEFSARLVG